MYHEWQQTQQWRNHTLTLLLCRLVHIAVAATDVKDKRNSAEGEEAFVEGKILDVKLFDYGQVIQMQQGQYPLVPKARS